ncbi:MAG: NAD(P)-binding domain-containing protein [Gammaproteobacteria bacterium]|nr:NAD(P)-binding domain-containing protein [Gammaproteobacteria bacterium]
MQITLIGAGGKMGTRLADNLEKHGQQTFYVETAPDAVERMQARGRPVHPADQVVARSEVVILAVPDRVIGQVSRDIVPLMKAGSMLVLLDPAAAYIGSVTLRDDLALFVTHPCHPSVFNYDATPVERRDFFGGLVSPQAIVCALVQGDETQYTDGENLARILYAPVTRAHRLTLHQMAILEPAMAETIGAALVATAKDAVDEAVRFGVPRDAALDFMFGHLNIELGIVFGEAGNPFSDAAKIAIDYGRQRVIRNNWSSLFEEDSIRDQIHAMLGHPRPQETYSK